MRSVLIKVMRGEIGYEGGDTERDLKSGKSSKDFRFLSYFFFGFFVGLKFFKRKRLGKKVG